MARLSSGLIQGLINPGFSDSLANAGAQFGMLGGQMVKDRKEKERMDTLRGLGEEDRLKFAVTNAKTPEELLQAQAGLEEFQQRTALRNAQHDLVGIQRQMEGIARTQGGKSIDQWDEASRNKYIELQGEADTLAQETRGMDQQAVSVLGNNIANAQTNAENQAQALANQREAAQAARDRKALEAKEREVSGAITAAMSTGDDVDDVIKGLDPEDQAYARRVFNEMSTYEQNRRQRAEREADMKAPVDFNIVIPDDLPAELKAQVNARLSRARALEENGKAGDGTWLPGQRDAAIAARNAAEAIVMNHQSAVVSDAFIRERGFDNALARFDPSEKEIEAFMDEVNRNFISEWWSEEDNLTRDQAIEVMRAQHARATAQAYGQAIPEWARLDGADENAPRETVPAEGSSSGRKYVKDGKEYTGPRDDEGKPTPEGWADPANFR